MLLLLIFVFAFIYRIVLMLWQRYPPGADIGLHNSVINSITQSGNTNFLYDFYQMGGGLSLTFPGYHIFASAILMMTGMSDYVAQAVMVSFFSSLIVLCAFLITKKVWNESAAFIVAFLVAVSRFDIEMLMWAGYPDVITLFLIPLTFYLFLQRERFSLTPFLISTSIMVGSIFLTHSLSSVVFVGITLVTVFFAMIAPKTFNTTRKNVFYWLLPMVGGALLVSPFIANAIPAYLSANSTLTGISVINQAVLAERIVPITWVLAIAACLLPYFLLSKKYKGHFLSLPTFLLIMWLLVPLVLTQGYLYGLIVDYNRFLYFLILPVIILFAMMIDHGSAYFAKLIDSSRHLIAQAERFKKGTHKWASKISYVLTRKRIYLIFLFSFLILLLLYLPIFANPSEAVGIQSFYQVMSNPGYQAMQWTKQNTPPGSVFVSDAEYGWWFGGFAERPTLSAVSPEFLTVGREVAPAQVATNLLDTDYIIDNGYIQVKEDGGYIGRHNPLFVADLNWTYYPFPFLQFNSNQITLSYQDAGSVQSTDVTQIPVTNMQLVGAQTSSPSIVVNKGNCDFNYSEILTVSQGVRFANMTIVVQSNNQNVTLDWLNFLMNSAGQYEQPFGNTLAILDVPLKECCQLIFAQNQPQISPLNSEYPSLTQLTYNLQGKSTIEIQVLVGLYIVSVNDLNSQSSLDQTLAANIQDAQTPTVSLPMTTFDYLAAIKANNISYIANRDPDTNQKYYADPAFSLVFINNDVAIFKVNTNLLKSGR